MKVAVSIPDDVFDEADRLAEKLGASRSALYTKALSAYVQTHTPDKITQLLDDVIGAVGHQEEVEFAIAASAGLLRKVAW